MGLTVMQVVDLFFPSHHTFRMVFALFNALAGVIFWRWVTKDGRIQACLHHRLIPRFITAMLQWYSLCMIGLGVLLGIGLHDVVELFVATNWLDKDVMHANINATAAAHFYDRNKNGTNTSYDGGMYTHVDPPINVLKGHLDISGWQKNLGIGSQFFGIIGFVIIFIQVIQMVMDAHAKTVCQDASQDASQQR